MDAAHAARLLELARSAQEDPGKVFVEGPATDDDLAEELAETAVETMTSGEEALTEELEEEVDEEEGGPFVETSHNVEFAGGTDESNIPEATREPLPLANRQKGK